MATLDPVRPLGTRREIAVYETAAALDADAAFNTPVHDGAAADDWVERGQVRYLDIFGTASHASAASGVKVEESENGSDVDHTTTLRDVNGATTVAADTAVKETVRVSAKYYRFEWLNGGTQQTSFRCRVAARTD